MPACPDISGTLVPRAGISKAKGGAIDVISREHPTIDVTVSILDLEGSFALN